VKESLIAAGKPLPPHFLSNFPFRNAAFQP
jgi:hypothetical protein